MKAPTGWMTYGSPLGPLTLVAGLSGVRGVHFPGRGSRLAESARREMPKAAAQLEEYFAGERRRFELDLELLGTPLQRAVWARLQEIPYGATTTYGSLTGYLGGLQRKQALLELEGRVAAGLPPVPAWSFRQTAML